MTLHSEDFGGLNGRCVSVRLDTNDVTFGGVEKVEAAFEEIMDEYNPECVMLISTCIVEIIGDDFDALANGLTKKYNIPVLPVHTEHFKCADHIPGIQRSISACIDLIDKQECDNSVNLLGQRFGDFEKTEVAQILAEQNVKFGLQLPNNCSLDDIKVAGRAKVNIVVNDTAVELAQSMKAKLGIPYVYFGKFSSYESNYKAYQELFKYLEKELPAKITEHYEKIKAEFEKHKQQKDFEGLTYIYGPSAFVPFEHVRMMTEFGMKPLIIQLSRLEGENYQDDIKEILKKEDPPLAQSANVTGLIPLYDVLKPDLSMGAGYVHVLREKGIVIVQTNNANNMLGLEMSELFLKSLIDAKQEVQALKEKK